MIFIVGNSRSGTTMLSRAIGLHSTIHTFQEIHFFESMTDSNSLCKKISHEKGVELLNKLIGIQREGFYKQRNLDCYRGESQNIISKLKSQQIIPIKIYSEFLEYWTKLNNKKIACEQTPKNIFYLNEINSNISRAYFLNLIRDPRSVSLSQKNKWKRRYLGEKEMPLLESVRAWTLYHPITIAKLWVAAVRQSENYTEKNILTVKFEDLVGSPENVIRNICRFINVEYEENMLNVPQVGSSLDIDSNTRQGINAEKASTWENSSLSNTEIYLVEKIARRELNNFGYQLSGVKPNYITLISLLVTFPLKIFFSLILNFKRMKNIREVLKKRFFN